MSGDTLQGQWNQLKGKVRQEWGTWTNDDVDVIEGQSEQLVGRIQELLRDRSRRSRTTSQGADPRDRRRLDNAAPLDMTM